MFSQQEQDRNEMIITNLRQPNATWATVFNINCCSHSSSSSSSSSYYYYFHRIRFLRILNIVDSNSMLNNGKFSHGLFHCWLLSSVGEHHSSFLSIYPWRHFANKLNRPIQEEEATLNHLHFCFVSYSSLMTSTSLMIIILYISSKNISRCLLIKVWLCVCVLVKPYQQTIDIFSF